jgi:hypothetical protein
MDILDYRRAMIALAIIAGVLLAGIFIIGAMAAAGEKNAGEISADYAMINALDMAQGNIQKDLSDLDSVVADGAAGIGQSQPEGDPGLAILSGMGNSGPVAIDAVKADLNGTIVAISPDRYKSVIGADISNQTHIKRLYERKIPVMSNLFMTVEGFPAVDIASPVFSQDGKFIGSTTLLISPGILIGRDLPPTANGTVSWDAWVVQEDGTLLFASDGEPAGDNISGNPGLANHPDLVSLAGNITKQWQGNLTGTFTDMQGKPVTKHIVWTTVGIRGTEWRLVFSREITKSPGITDILNETIV